DVFVRGGREAVEALVTRGPWVQVSVSMPTDDASARGLQAQVRQFVGALFSDALIDNFFFMFKPPGLRLRFEATGAVFALTNVIKAQMSRWRSEGLVDMEF